MHFALHIPAAFLNSFGRPRRAAHLLAWSTWEIDTVHRLFVSLRLFFGVVRPGRVSLGYRRRSGIRVYDDHLTSLDFQDTYCQASKDEIFGLPLSIIPRGVRAYEDICPPPYWLLTSVEDAVLMLGLEHFRCNLSKQVPGLERLPCGLLHFVASQPPPS